jgi:ribose/xylose/arabinose/galactoside ABC-type transport system permease subunit
MKSTSRDKWIRRPEFNVTIVLLVLIAVAGLVNPVFVGADNLVLTVKWTSIYAMFAIGEMLVILSGGIDLTAGAMISWSSVLFGIFAVWLGMNWFMAIVSTLAIALCIGFVQGALTTRFSPPLPYSVPCLIVTLSVNFILSGLGLVITKGYPIVGLPEPFSLLGASFYGIPASLFTFLVLLAITTYILHFTPLGCHIYAVGGGADQSYLVGVKVSRTRIFCFCFAALTYAIAGLTFTSIMHTSHTLIGSAYMLPAVTAVALGGVSLAGGEGNIAMPIIGSAVLYVIDDALVMLGTSAFWHDTLVGGILLTVVIVDFSRRRKRF